MNNGTHSPGPDSDWMCFAMIRLVLSRPYTILGIILCAVLLVPLLRRQQDWQTVFLPAAERLSSGEDIFQAGFVYPPINAWMALPFLALPYWAERLLWYTINMVAMMILIIGAWKLSGGRSLEAGKSVPKREHAIFWLGLGCGISSCTAVITNEQTDLIVAALLILGCLALTRRQDVVCGVWFGIAAA